VLGEVLPRPSFSDHETLLTKHSPPLFRARRPLDPVRRQSFCSWAARPTVRRELRNSTNRLAPLILLGLTETAPYDETATNRRLSRVSWRPHRFHPALGWSGCREQRSDEALRVRGLCPDPPAPQNYRGHDCVSHSPRPLGFPEGHAWHGGRRLHGGLRGPLGEPRPIGTPVVVASRNISGNRRQTPITGLPTDPMDTKHFAKDPGTGSI